MAREAGTGARGRTVSGDNVVAATHSPREPECRDARNCCLKRRTIDATRARVDTGARTWDWERMPGPPDDGSRRGLPGNGVAMTPASGSVSLYEPDKDGRKAKVLGNDGQLQTTVHQPGSVARA